MKVLKWLWQLPQHLVAGILYLVLRNRIDRVMSRTYQEKTVYYGNYHTGVCLGQYIFLDADHATWSSLDHEYGHSLQSEMLGPLYLLVVGIPSAVFCNLYDKVFHRHWTDNARYQWYYSRWPENWADRLGGVQR